MTKNMHIRQIPLSSNQVLLELVYESLDQFLGKSHTVISTDLPYEGNHILALDANNKAVLLCCDSRDGGRALLNGLMVLDGLTSNRAWFYRLYPALFKEHSNNPGGFQLENIRLMILAPTPPPGGTYLNRLCPSLIFFLARALEINGEIGLFLEKQEAATAGADSQDSAPESSVIHPFQDATPSLTEEEEAFFQE